MKSPKRDHLRRTAKVTALAQEVFEDREQALEWLAFRQAGLGDRVPFDLMETKAGTRRVVEELKCIEHGFVA